MTTVNKIEGKKYVKCMYCVLHFLPILRINESASIRLIPRTLDV